MYDCIYMHRFMYTGHLEYWTSEQHALYRTAQKMKMTVLTKLLDAQFNTSNLQAEATKTPARSAITVSKSSTPITKPVISSISTLSGQPLPGRKYVLHDVMFQAQFYL